VARKTEVGPAAVHLILGEDSYLAEEALERILTEAIGTDRDDSLRVLQGDEVKWEAVVAAARAGSLFASRRAVLVRRADLIRGPKEDEDPGAQPHPAKKAKAEEHPMLRYLEAPAPDATLVLLAAKPDRRRNPWKRLSAEALVHAAEPLRKPQLRAYVEGDLRRRGLRLSADALSGLLEEVGQDLRRLMGEVDKLEAWSGERKEALSADDVHAVLGRGLGRPLYLFADALAGRDLPEALARLEELLEGGEEGLRVLATAHRAVRQVRAATGLRERRTPRSEIGRRLLPPNMQFKLDALLDASERWTGGDLRRAIVALNDADRRIKRGADASTALVAAVVEACRGEGRVATSSSRRAR
jgi:DNA polymerase-3 subunit delta